MKIAIVGSRNYPHRKVVEAFVDGLPAGTVVISGGARGVDTWAVQRAMDLGLQVIVCRPNYVRYLHRAPLVRNQEIVDRADWVVAFWDGKSRGTQHTIGLARKAGKSVTVYGPTFDGVFTGV